MEFDSTDTLKRRMDMNVNLVAKWLKDHAIYADYLTGDQRLLLDSASKVLYTQWEARFDAE